MKIERKKDVGRIRIVEHNRKLFWVIVVLLIILIGILIYVKMHPSSNEAKNNTQNSQMANPASVYCVDNGGNLTIVTAADGSQSGMCTLKNGTQCDEWKYFRGEC